jgi:hypothetical protein
VLGAGVYAARDATVASKRVVGGALVLRVAAGLAAVDLAVRHRPAILIARPAVGAPNLGVITLQRVFLGRALGGILGRRARAAVASEVVAELARAHMLAHAAVRIARFAPRQPGVEFGGLSFGAPVVARSVAGLLFGLDARLLGVLVRHHALLERGGWGPQAPNKTPLPLLQVVCRSRSEGLGGSAHRRRSAGSARSAEV